MEIILQVLLYQDMAKDKMMIYGEGGDERIKIIPTENSFRNRFCLKDDTIIKLAKWIVIIEEY
jgi:pyruvate,water dikinase